MPFRGNPPSSGPEAGGLVVTQEPGLFASVWIRTPNIGLVGKETHLCWPVSQGYGKCWAKKYGKRLYKYRALNSGRGGACQDLKC